MPCPTLSDKPQRTTLLTACRRTLLDPNARWWTDTELNDYIEDWQIEIQNDLELIWGTATVTTSTATVTISALASDIQRIDAVYWNDKRLVGRNIEDLDEMKRDWRGAAPQEVPRVVYQDDSRTFSFYPPPLVAGTVVVEYPKSLTFTTDTSPMSLPAWCRYSCQNFVAYRAYLRAGPNQDINRAMKRKNKFEAQKQKIRVIRDNFFAQRSPHLRPGGTYEGNILDPRTPLVP